MALDFNDIRKKNGFNVTSAITPKNSTLNFEEIRKKNGINTANRNSYKTIMNATSTRSYDEAVKANQKVGTYPQNLKKDNKVITEAKQQLYNTLNNATSTRSYDEAVKESQPLPFTNSSGTLDPFALTKGIQQQVKYGQADALIGQEARKTMQERIDYNGYGLPTGFNKNDVEAYKILSGKNEDQVRKEVVSGLMGNNPEYDQIQKETKVINRYDSITPVANYTLGDLQLDLNKAYYDYSQNPSDYNKKKVERIEKLISMYSENAKNVGKGGIFTKDFATYLPQQVGQIEAGLRGAAVGGGAGAATGASIGSVIPAAGTVAGALTGLKLGSKAGYVGGVTKYSYEQMQGGAYKDLVDMGVPEDVALDIAKDTALWQSLIEGAGAGVDIATLGLGKLFTQGPKTAAQMTAKQMIADALKAYGINLVSEAVEEGTQEVVSIKGEKEAMKRAGLERQTTSEEDLKRVGEAAKGGAILGGIMGGGNLIGNIGSNITNTRSAQQNVSPQSSQIEQTQSINEVIPSAQQNQNMANVTKTKIYKGFHGTDSEFNEYSFDNFGKHDQGDFGKAIYFSTNKNTAQKYGKNIKESDMEISNPLILNTENDYINMWGEVVKSIDNQQMTEIMNNLDEVEIKLLNDEYTPQQDKNFLLYNKLTADEKANLLQKLGYDGVVDNIYNQIAIFDLDRLNKKQVGEQYSLAEQSSVRRSAKNIIQKGWKIQDSTIESLESIQNKRQGLTIEFDDSIKGNGVYTVNEDGSRNIKINPNAERAIEFTVTHELAHDLKTGDEKSYKELQNFVLKYAQGFKDYNSAVKALGETYAKQLGEGNFVLNDEATNDIIAQAIGNQNFLNSLAQEQPNIFMRAYNWVKNVLFDGNKSGLTLNERRFLNSLQSKFRVAYNQTYDGNATSQENYSIGGQVGLQNAINNDKRFTKLQDNLSMAQTMARTKAEQNIDNEYIRQKTNWFQDKNGDWKFEFSDKFMTLKDNVKLEENNTYKLGDILKHDLLFTIYPEFINYKVSYLPLGKNKSGTFVKANNEIRINSKLKDKKKIEGTLIHEIQHAIQKIENFEGGKSAKLSRLAYYQNLGEIEADNTKNRFIQETEKNLNRDAVAPESSKTNPKHSKLNNYLNNRTTIDKIKDGIYKYLKDRGVIHDSINEEIDSQNMDRNRGLVVRRGNIEELEVK